MRFYRKFFIRPSIIGAVCIMALLFVASYAVAQDRIKILDGGTVEGSIISEDENYILIRRKSGDIQQIKAGYD